MKMKHFTQINSVVFSSLVTRVPGLSIKRSECWTVNKKVRELDCQSKGKSPGQSIKRQECWV